MRLESLSHAIAIAIAMAYSYRYRVVKHQRIKVYSMISNNPEVTADKDRT